MPPVKTLIRQDGTTLRVSPEEAEKLKLLGYREETQEETSGRLESEAREEYYTSGSQKVATALEGVARGFSMGASDFLLGSEETSQRAKYNPGTAMATEILGALPEGGPLSLVAKGAKAVVPGTKLAAKTLRGAIEGGAFGGAMAADHAHLEGDPITAEAVLHGIGWGSLFGGGLSAMGGLVAARGEAKIASGAKLEAEAGAYTAGAESVLNRESSFALREAELAGERAAISKAEAQAKSGGVRYEVAPGTYAAIAEPAYATFKAEAREVSKRMKNSISTVEALMSNNRRKIAELGFADTLGADALGKARIELAVAARKVSKAMNAKGFNGEELKRLIYNYEQVAGKVARKAGLTATDEGRQALMEYAQAKVIQRELKKFPHTAEQFAGMSPKRAEDLFASLGELKKMSNHSEMGAALEAQANAFQEALGVSPGGIDGLRAAWNASRKALKAEKTVAKMADFKQKRIELAIKEADLKMERAKFAAEKAVEPPKVEPGLGRKIVGNIAGYGAYKGMVTIAPQHPIMALGVAGKIRNKVMNFGIPKTPELIAARNASLGRIKQAVGKYQVKAGNAVNRVAPKLSPLAIRLDGTVDSSTKNVQQLAYNRIQEFASAVPHIKDTMYAAIEPIAIEQPKLGPALHQASLASFNSMRSLLPADPGVVSGLKPIWKPSALQAAVMSRQLEVWQDPVGAAEEMLSTNIYDPIRVKTLKQVAPAIFQQLRVEMLGRIEEPGFLDSMDYRAQVSLGSLLEIPIHSSMRPEFIAASQQLHTNRNQPLPTPASAGAGGSRSPADTPGATPAQISTAR